MPQAVHQVLATQVHLGRPQGRSIEGHVHAPGGVRCDEQEVVLLDVDGDEIFGRCFEEAPQRAELPLGNELVAVEIHAPVAGTAAPCGVLEVAVPFHRPLLAPGGPEDDNLRVDTRDRFVRAVRGVALVDDDLVGERQVMTEHLHDMEVEPKAIANEGVE